MSDFNGNIENNSLAGYFSGNEEYQAEMIGDGRVGPQGPRGPAGPQGKPGLPGPQGIPGKGISSIVLVNTSGLVDTYRITYTDETTQDYYVTNGLGTLNHNSLENRSLLNQHPISAITGLEEALENAGGVKDVKVDGTTVVDEQGNANIEIPDGQIIVDYFDDLPMNVPDGSKAYVKNETAGDSWETPTDLYDGKQAQLKFVENPINPGTETTSMVWSSSQHLFAYDGAGNMLPVPLMLMSMDEEMSLAYVYVWEDFDTGEFRLQGNSWNFINGVDGTAVVVNYEDIQFPATAENLNNAQDIDLIYSNLLENQSSEPKLSGDYQFNGTTWDYLPYSGVKNDGSQRNYLSEDGKYYEIPTPNIPVLDVKVNGESIVDNTKVAQVLVPTQASDINAQPIKPNGLDDLIASDTGKVNAIYLPPASVGGIINGGYFNENGIITASSYAPELQGQNIDSLYPGFYTNYYFICNGLQHTLQSKSYQMGDWAISDGYGWQKLNSSDAVTSVNGKLGTVVLNHTDVGASKAIVTETFTLENWQQIYDKSPFNFGSTIVVQNTINDNTILSLSMDLVKQTTYGIGIGYVSLQTIIIYSITRPEETLTIDIVMED